MSTNTFSWDKWQAEALENHLSKEFTALGRDAMREACQHLWSPQLANICSPRVLNRLLFDCPELSRNLYQTLLETDGLCIAHHETTGELIELDSFGF